jgi:hypothetical protein
MNERFERAIALIDARNRDDPNTIVVRGERRPKEQAHSELVFEWVKRLRPDAGEALLLAARAHHVRRWEIPRASYPEGRVAYLKWRNALQQVHAAELRAAMLEAGYDDATTGRAEFIVRKRDLARDPDVRILEDAICLVFLETQFHQISAKLDRAKMVDVLRKTMRKMSPPGIAAAAALELRGEDRSLFDEAERGL